LGNIDRVHTRVYVAQFLLLCLQRSHRRAFRGQSRVSMGVLLYRSLRFSGERAEAKEEYHFDLRESGRSLQTVLTFHDPCG